MFSPRGVFILIVFVLLVIVVAHVFACERSHRQVSSATGGGEMTCSLKPASRPAKPASRPAKPAASSSLNIMQFVV